MIPVLLLSGALSVYAPHDGHNAGSLACGGRLTWQSRGIAIRGWRGRCGAQVLVCAWATGRCALTTIADSGPWGATDGQDWRVMTGALPMGWRRRADVDLPWALWLELGRPRFLSRITVILIRPMRWHHDRPTA